ncbi:MAG: hypothetical protein M3134_10510 [Actinomycetota bacterium]|nr:hypothetical protein [Actinomycetota bacterium]
MARDVEQICKLTQHGVLGLYRGSAARFPPYVNFPQSRLDALVGAINRCTANPFASEDGGDPVEPAPPPDQPQPQPQAPTAHDADWRLKRGVLHQRLLPAPTDPDSSIAEWILVRQTFRTTDFQFRWYGNGYFDIRAPENFPDDQIVYFTYRVRDSQGLESNRAIATIRFCAEDARDGCA